MKLRRKTESNRTAPNILKSRDDPRPTYLTRVQGANPDDPEFELATDTTSTWASAGVNVGIDKLRPRIEPWLTALCQSEHLSLLVGSGLTSAIHHMIEGQPPSGMAPTTFGGAFATAIDRESRRSSEAAGRPPGNFEDQLRTASELLRGLEILGSRDPQKRHEADTLQNELAATIAAFAASILQAERNIIRVPIERRETAFNYLVSFLMSFASRTGTRDRLHMFTTNYDRLLEAGSEAAGMHLIDRFVGCLAPVFRSSRLDIDIHYNPPGIRGEPRYMEGVCRFTKLHGSLDWIELERGIRRLGVPFGAETIEPYIRDLGLPEDNVLRIMVYPNSAKDRETAGYPYVELFRDFAAATCRPNHTLFTFGYSFGDEHINRVIEDMLTIPSTHLVIIAYDDPLGRIMTTYAKLGRHSQISILLGDHLGSFKPLVEHYLPKPAIDRTTFRMSELLRSRWGTYDAESPLAPRDNEPPVALT